MVPGSRAQLQALVSRRACACGLMAGALAVLTACSAAVGTGQRDLAVGVAAAAPGAPQAPGEIGTPARSGSA